MATAKQAGTRRLKMAERAQQAMNIHFPDVDPAFIWSRKTNDGYSTIPRTLPIVMQAADDLSKGQPPGHTLFCLWMRAPDHPLVTIENPATFAAEAGFGGERAVDTWRKRMRRLRELNLIFTKEGPTGEFHYTLLMNPNVILECLREDGKVNNGVYARFKDRLIEVGGFGDIEAYEKYKKAEATAEKKGAAEAKAAAAAHAASPTPPATTPAATPAGGSS